MDRHPACPSPDPSGFCPEDAPTPAPNIVWGLVVMIPLALALWAVLALLAVLA